MTDAQNVRCVDLPGHDEESIVAIDLSTLPPRKGTRPTTTGKEIPHDQLEQFSPPEIRAALVAYAETLPGVATGPSLVSEPGSFALRLGRAERPFDAFLHPEVDEFGHIHRSGFLHLTVPREYVRVLDELGWTEPHPITRRAEFPDTIVMLYAPRDAEELAVATAVLRASYEQAVGDMPVRMRAVTVDAFGETPTATAVDVPVPGPGELLVRVAASSLNGFDQAVVHGVFRDMMEHTFPVTLGKDFAGTVVAVGDGVERPLGARVFGVVMKPAVHDGAFADFVVVSDGYGVAAIPDGVDFADAGALGLAGAAAVGVVEAVAPAAGDTVLVVGATGGVGAYAVQLAATAGATVVATAAPGAQADFVRALGAAHVVDASGDLAAQVRAIAPAGVSAAIHLAGDPQALVDLVAPGGRLASTLGVGPEAADGRDVTVVPVMADPSAATLDRLAAAVASGALRVPVQSVHHLEDVAAAMAGFAAGTLGKVGVSVS
ncbi:alcohol dehydrogenase catalytic domain-containing protein [Yinghuangia seranimata]|uniref:luciferase domain-containing protein n=1 Tax=Yinghuangia seranimata TaxID=408067 RepID=UPI00248BED0B|nr:zinc-binding dehydrogenase [Yinghuangia seranimata]MDI2128515.1 zinc-binding dehydrogenase [Yinghuangia seranimata]